MHINITSTHILIVNHTITIIVSISIPKIYLSKQQV